MVWLLLAVVAIVLLVEIPRLPSLGNGRGEATGFLDVSGRNVPARADHGARSGASGSTVTEDGRSAALWGTTIGSISVGASSHEKLPAHDRSDDAALLAALEQLERRMAAAIAKARESVVALEYSAPETPPGTRRVASGVVINHRGDVVSVRIEQPPTSPSPTGGNRTVIVARDCAGKTHVVHWVAADPETGLTLLRLPPRAVPPIRTASGGAVLGSQVFVVGNPFGMGHSVSRGHLAGLGRALELGARQLGGLIQVQAPLYPGDSGAAVVNLQGDWLGLIRSGLAMPRSDATAATEPVSGPNFDPGPKLSALSARAETGLGLAERDTDFGFAIPAPDVLWVAEQLRIRGRVDRAYLGVRLESSPTYGDSVRGAANPSTSDGSDAVTIAADKGAVVREVLTDTPAAQSGLKPGDGIIELDGQPIRSSHDLTDRLDRIPAQAAITLGVVRDRGPREQHLAISVRTANRPLPPPIMAQASPEPTPTRAPSANTLIAAPTPVSATSIVPVSATMRADARRANAETAVVPPQPDELRLTLPRAIVERLEKLEGRLQKLESVPARAGNVAPNAERQISSRNP